MEDLTPLSPGAYTRMRRGRRPTDSHVSLLTRDAAPATKAVRDWIDTLAPSRTKPNIYVGDMRNEINDRTRPIAPCYY